jgi:hypothetical protein
VISYLWDAFGNQAFRQGDQLHRAFVWLPDDAAIVEDSNNDAVRGSPEGFDAVAWLYEFVEGEGFSLLAAPFCCNRCLSLSIKAVLRSTSLARSSVEADDKLPSPVFEKLGSGL